MSVPGSNLLLQASRLIKLQSLVYRAYASRAITAPGLQAPAYAPDVNVKGSIQPVPRSLMETLGLDMQRNYVNIYVPQRVVDVQRDVGSDQFLFGSIIYQCISSTPWALIDGWTGVLCVQVPNVG